MEDILIGRLFFYNLPKGKAKKSEIHSFETGPLNTFKMRRVLLDIFEKELGIKPLGQNLGYLVRITAPDPRPVHLIKKESKREPQKSSLNFNF